MNNLAEIKRLTIAFKRDKRLLVAVDDVTFTLNSGKTLALLGESGCGKSLTSMGIMRLLPPDALYGSKSAIQLGEFELLDLPEQIMRGLRGKRVAMIFQEPMTALNPVLTVGEQLAEAIEEHQVLSPPDVHMQMLTLLKEVEIPEPEVQLKKYPHQLSGGQKQRIIIAMALACKPDILIADEPTTALDVTIQSQILTLLKKLQRQYQMSLLLITHDLGVVKAMADTVCVMYAGQIVETSPAATFFNQPLHPYAQQLFQSFPSYEKRGQQLQTIAGSVPTLDAIPSGCRFHPRCAHAFAPCKDSLPLLQTMHEDQTVRCHLYPEHSQPPPLVTKIEHWQTSVNSNDIILSVEHLAVHYTARHSHEVFKAVDGISFELHKGKTLALVGESGCGKTTVSRALILLQPITSGRVNLQGEDISLLRGRVLRDFCKKVQIIFQDPYSSMNPRMTVNDILAEGMQAQGMSSAKIRLRQYELLDQVNLSRESLHRYPHQFSGGQRQRICIARALATEPKLLICDEPTSALDMSVQAQILNLLKSLQQELGLSYLFITHNMGVVSYIADDVLVMQRGKAVEMGDCKTILSSPKAEYTRQLLSSVLVI